MKIAFFSNYLNHHQLPFSINMTRLTNDKYRFIATTPIEQERLDLGYVDMNAQYSFVIRAYENGTQEELATQIANTSDVVIIGSAPDKYISKRLSQNMLTFRYSERIYKTGVWKAFLPHRILRNFILHTRYYKNPLYMLCASAYTAYDFSLHKAYIGKTFKWGYFPEFKDYGDFNDILKHKSTKIINILWVGRFISWKHPEIVIEIAERLKEKGHSFKVNMIGNGTLLSNIKALVREKGLDDCVSLLGSMSPSLVREYMERANIFLFTSDFNEGWGAVLNEAMNSGCAVVASHAIGSVPYLLQHGDNGFIYKYGDNKQAYRFVENLINNPEECKYIGKNAYFTIKDTWNAEEASKRLLCLIDCIMSGKDANLLYKDGPCSPAAIMHNDWYKN